MKFKKNPLSRFQLILEDHNGSSRLVKYLERLIEQQERAKKDLYIDRHIGINNLIKYFERIKIYPDYIKVDGEIIKNIHSKKENMIVLETIIFMAKKLGTDIVAEFVGDKVIQDIIKNLGIAYSQGYYFSKPEPICGSPR